MKFHPFYFGFVFFCFYIKCNNVIWHNYIVTFIFIKLTVTAHKKVHTWFYTIPFIKILFIWVKQNFNIYRVCTICDGINIYLSEIPLLCCSEYLAPYHYLAILYKGIVNRHKVFRRSIFTHKYLYRTVFYIKTVDYKVCILWLFLNHFHYRRENNHWL